MIEPQIISTADGSQSLRHPVYGDTYHSVNGAVAESRHVFIDSGLSFLEDSGKIRVLEVGFGSGLNALLTLDYAERNRSNIDYTAVELFPVSSHIAARMSYAGHDRFMELHNVPWNSRTVITDTFTLLKLHSDLADTVFDTIFDIVYFDAFAPETQPELWTVEIFAKVHNAMSAGGVLVTYSAKGDVKRALRDVGFKVERLKGAPGKRHMIRAIRIT